MALNRAMKPIHSLHMVVVAALLVASGDSLRAEDDAEVTAALEQLQAGHDLDGQLDALQRITTSLDPRIPAACRPLLASTGQSIRRNAARAIGSRWHQIPKAERPGYLRSLSANLKSNDPALVNMTHRAIGLLDRKYRGDMFSRSPNGRWVIYERRGKPCLIDTRTDTEELLGHHNESWFLPAIGNEPIQPSCLWHPKGEMVALQMLVFRHTSLVWIWRHKTGLRLILPKELISILKPAEGRILPNSSFTIRPESWRDDTLQLTVGFTVENKGNVNERVGVVRWNADTDQFNILSDNVRTQ